MLERLDTRAARAAEACASEKTAELAEQLRALLPKQIRVKPDGEGVLISGPGLGRRIVLDASLRWTIAGLLK